MPSCRLGIVGASGYAKEVAVIAASIGMSVAGFIQKDANSAQTTLPVLGTDECMAEIIQRYELSQIHIAVADIATRQKLVSRLGPVQYGHIVHTTAVVMNNSVGEGTVIYPGAIIMTGCQIGRHCLLNGGAYLGHDVSVGDFCNIAPSASIGGNVSIGAGTRIGIGACVRDGVQIGAGVTVGAGAVVVRDIPDNAVSYGNPSRVH